MSAPFHVPCMRSTCREHFAHPASSECPSARGKCAHLVGAGWRPVSARIEAQPPEGAGGRPVHVLTQWGWLCPRCVAMYLPASQRSLW